MVELDGTQHYDPDNERYDAERTKQLEACGLRVLRFSNYDMARYFEGVCGTIDRAVNESLGK